MIGNILVGLGAGIAYSVNGWWNKSKKSDEKFDPVKFAKTIVIGAVIGGASFAFGIAPEAAELSLTGIGIIGMLDVALTAGINNLWGYISNR